MQHLGLHTDLYELRMVASYLARGMTADATFSLFIRATPQRPWFVALGIEQAIAFVEGFGYGPEELSYLRDIGFDDATLDALGSLRPSGGIVAVDEGTIVLADEPILEITAPLPFAQLIETAMINLVQYPTLVATKAARMRIAAGERGLVDFGFRRAHGLQSGVEAARAAHIGAGMPTSNVEAGRRYGIPVVGTMAHAFVQSFTDELDAFRAFAADHPDGCVLLVDTYDSLDGVRNAIIVAEEMASRGQRLRGIRLDSGDLASLAKTSRVVLDDAGLTDVQIIVSGGLDEHDIARLVSAGAPIDAFGVGTDLVTSADRPAVDIAYKLVNYDGRDVAKYSEGKATLPGAKQVFRTGGPSDDVLALRDERIDGTPLLTPVWRDRKTLRSSSIDQSRARVEAGLQQLPDEWRSLDPFDEVPRPRYSDALTGGS